MSFGINGAGPPDSFTQCIWLIDITSSHSRKRGGSRSANLQPSNLTSRGNAAAGTSKIALRCLCEGSERRMGAPALAFNAGITWESREFYLQGARDRS